VELISQRGKDVLYLKDFDSIVEYLNKNAKAGDLVLTVGAGNIYEVGEMFLKGHKKAVGM